MKYNKIMVKNKYILLIVFIICTTELFGQYKGEFSIGLGTKYSYFQIYNKSDWNNKPKSYAIMDNEPNKKSFGISADYILSDNMGLKASLLYSDQYQKYFVSYFGGIYDSRIYTSLKYLNLPIQFFYFTEIFSNSNWYVKGSLGFQLSFSFAYYSEFKQYYVNPDKNYKVEFDSIFNLIIRKPFYSYQKFITIHNEVLITEKETDYLYNRIIVSGIANIGIEKYYLNIFKFGIGIDIQYALNKTENYNNQKSWKGNLGQCSNRGVCKSHNRSLGIYFTVKYILNPQSYYK